MAYTRITQPFMSDNFLGGSIDEGAVGDFMLPRNACRRAINVRFDKPLGAITQRLGTTILGTDKVNGANAVTGLYNFRDAGSGTNNQIIATSNGTNFYLNGSNVWTSTLSGDTAGLKTRFVTFLDEVVRLNGTDAAKSWTGNTASAWGTSGGNLDVGNWPTGTKFGVVFNSRVYTAGNTSAPDRLYASSIPSGGAISWTSGNLNVDINPQDGMNITGLATTGDLILIFKDRAMYRWKGAQGGDPNQLINIGTPSHDSIVRTDQGPIYFFGRGLNSVGFYRTTGGYPELISRPKQDYVDAISASYYGSISGFCDADNVYWSIGSVTVGGKTYTNAWYFFNIPTETQGIFSFDDRFQVFSPYITSTGAVTLLGGDTDGHVQTLFSGTTDNTAPISSEVGLPPMYFTGRERVKTLGELYAFAKQPNGLRLQMQADDGSVRQLGEIKGREQRFPSLSIRGRKFYPTITCVNSQQPFTFEGLAVTDVVDEGNV